MRSLLRLVVFSFQFLVFGFALAPAAAAQTVDVTGTVKDTSGAVLPGATIDASVAGLSVATTITGPDGRYQIALAPNTLHQLRASVDGFADEPFLIRTTAASVSHDFTLRIAAVADEVVVTAARVVPLVHATMSFCVISVPSVARIVTRRLDSGIAKPCVQSSSRPMLNVTMPPGEMNE